jgi:hypothetical protein
LTPVRANAFRARSRSAASLPSARARRSLHMFRRQLAAIAAGSPRLRLGNCGKRKIGSASRNRER